jgi:D-arabinan exo alpha-(1,3)/(1,5)-arabinofuranosidase (non-reducing end)
VGAAGYGPHGSSLRDLPRLRSGRRRRVSSWDRSGGNDDRVTLEAGATTTLCEVAGAGCVTHIWITVGPQEWAAPLTLEGEQMLRRLVLSMSWDGSDEPSVLVPLGDFFGVGHGLTTNFVSAPLQMSPEDGKGMNCFFQMPFADGARIQIRSEMEHEGVLLYYYVDYEIFGRLEDGLGRFHASWNREDPTDGEAPAGESNDEFLFEGTNLDGAGNYVILEAEGRGHYVGCVLSVLGMRGSDEFDWYGEGDDMIFIDGEPFPPSLHGTGTEDYFNTAWCPTQTYSAPYHGITLAGGENWREPVSLYRFHVEDPVMFERSIRVTIEHGHANKRSDDVSSTAYWYQELPQRPLSLAPVERRLPRRGPGRS